MDIVINVYNVEWRQTERWHSRYCLLWREFWLQYFPKVGTHLKGFIKQIARKHTENFWFSSLEGRWGVVQEFIFLPSSQVMLVILVWRPHFENHSYKEGHGRERSECERNNQASKEDLNFIHLKIISKFYMYM